MPCHSQWSISHRPLNFIQLCLELPPPFSRSTSLQVPFPGVPWLSSFGSLVVSTVVPAWRWCRHLSNVCVQANSIVFFLTAPALVLRQFSSTPCCWIFCPASVRWRSFRHLLISTCLQAVGNPVCNCPGVKLIQCDCFHIEVEYFCCPSKYLGIDFVSCS